jgi:L-ascorbate metabolism protein UlaG (beta-lactamase superfamily)
MGDTGRFGDIKLIADYYKPDLVLMPIGGHFVMDPQDAAYATREWLKPKFVIPIHYGTFPVLKGHAAGVYGGARSDDDESVSDQSGGSAGVLGATAEVAA